jgi:hypothetical protein
MRFAAPLVLLLGPLAACGSFGSSDAPTGGTPASGIDGGAAAEGGALEGGPPPPPPAGSGWCASQTPKHAFCADFDDATPLTKIFDSITDSSGANAVTLDSTMGSTKPGSLKFAIPAFDAGTGNLIAFADLKFQISAKGFRCELDVELDSAPVFVGSLAYITVGGIEIIAGSTLSVASAPSSVEYPLPGTTWMRIGIVTDIALGKVTVTENGLPVADRPLTLTTPPALAVVHFGTQYTTEAFTMRYDNITCDPL